MSNCLRDGVLLCAVQDVRCYSELDGLHGGADLVQRG